MVRKLTMAVALALGSASFHANGLGLGDIETKSGLNEPFRGKIGLVSVGEGELEGLRVRLASIADFERAGVGRPLFLSSLRFDPKALPGGRAVIEVTSDFPIREPFLNFLIEVNWPKGRLIREYTVLLDPPVTTTRRPTPVTAPSVTRSTAVAPAPAAAPRPAPEPIRRQPAAGEYGPVQANETMWTIARNLQPSDVSTEQMILAIQRANPDAFINGNVNLLKKGQILRIPSRDEILDIDRGQAREQFLAQQEAWLARLGAQAGATAAAPGTAAPKPEAQLRIATPRPEGEGLAGAGEDDAGRPTSDDLERELILARERAESARQETDNLLSRVDDLENEIGDMQRLLSLKDEQLAQLQASVQQQQEASVQPDEAATPAEDAEEPPAVAQTPAEPGAADQMPSETAGAPGDEAPADAAPPTDAAPTPADTQVAETAPETPDEAAAMAEEKSTAGLYDPDTVEAQQPAPAPEPPPAAAPEPEPAAAPTPATPAKAWYEQLPVIGGIAAVVVLLLGWLFARGRKSAGADAEAPIAAEESLVAATAGVGGAAFDASHPEPDTQELAEAVAASQAEADSDTLRELVDETEVASDLDAVQDDTGEVDPVSEADVYIAYGRYQQAEDLLRQALDKDPDRLAYKHKLLEVLYATKKAPDFVSVAQSMVDGGQDGVDPEAWVRIQEMGRDLDNDSVLFQPAAKPRPTLVQTEPPAEVPAPDDGADDHIDELSELVSELRLDDTPISEPGDMVAEADLSLELDELTREVEQNIDQAMEADSTQLTPDDLESLELDLPTVQADKRTLKEVNDPESLEHDDTLELPENSLEVLTEELEEEDIIPSLMTEDITRAEDVPGVEMDSDLEDLSELTSLDTQVEHASDRSGGLEPLDLTSVFDKEAVAVSGGSAAAAAEAGGNAAAEVVSGTFDVGDEATVDLDVSANSADADGFDDVETKLDLARAYVEMGDAEGARSILEEVKDEGDDQQRSQANQILAEIEA